jgi:hypothetical protein
VNIFAVEYGLVEIVTKTVISRISPLDEVHLFPHNLTLTLKKIAKFDVITVTETIRKNNNRNSLVVDYQ